MSLVSSPFARALLQTQAAAPSCQDQATLAGISVGGWIALATFAGIIIGIIATLLVQACCWRPAREARAQAYKVADEDAVPSPAADRAAASSLRGPGRYYAPLTSGAGNAQVALPPLSSRESRDTVPRSFKSHSPANEAQNDTMSGADVVADQKRPTGAAQQAKVAPVMAATAASPAVVNPILSMQTVAAHEARTQQQQQQQEQQQPRGLSGSTTDRVASALQRFGAVQASQVVSPSSSLSLSESAAPQSDHPLAHTQQHQARPAQQQAHSQPYSHQHKQQGQGQQEQEQQQLRPLSPGDSAGTAPTQGASELESEYELEDLDDDWKALLNDLDGRLQKRGASPMGPRERAVAIKKLLVATGSRGVDFAMQATLDEVLRFRRFSSSGAH